MEKGICYSSASLHLLVLMHLLVLVNSSATTSGPVINVTKNIYFAHFSLDDPRVSSDVKLLGSAKLSMEKGVIQIPDESVAFDLRHQAGRAIYSSPVRLLDPLTKTPASFQTTFAFQFSNSSAGGRHRGGSGLTFIIVPDEFTVGRPGPWLGMLNDACQENYKAVGIEFDTHRNPEFRDPNDNHVGVNLASIVSTKTIDALDFGVFLNDGSVHRAWITYDGPRRWMEIHLGSDGNDYPFKPIFSGSLDLSPHLNEYMFIGFSASTGNKTQIHNVLSWNFSATSQAFLRFPSEETCESKITLQKSEASAQTTQKRSTKEPSSSFFIFITVSVLALATMIGFIFCIRRGRTGNSKLTGLPEKTQRPRPPNKPRRFAFSEISSATRGLGEAEILGRDARGVYYRGKLSNGCQVAIKRLSAEFLNSQQGLDRRRLLKEIGSMSRVRHPNLVPIRGWCHDNNEMMIVYDFYTNGSLDKWLFGGGFLPWTRRLKVINDIAEALSFLHSKQLAHKNMKTSSVFLDVSFRAVLGDFGMVLSATDSRRFESAISQTADVFEFGIFVLEVVSGRGRLDQEAKQDERDLVDFAWRMHVKDEKVKVVDGRMGSLVNLEQAIRVLEIGLLCTLNESKGRPGMQEVVEYLSNDTHIPELPACRPVSLFPYNSATGLCTGYSCGPFK
ncbi:mitochondrial chaperone BCS1-like [Hibiscus syriacus]|uniref:Mitochondrial chaperone BCS1-like n=1 Tax=Hibiscus syriacus TaxID=106335 RepID=A0A6A3AKX6_HIBSY|nr:L-type lectin-domain containing receptor kinase VIII.1-like [Hibiscus syriacus]KAE8705261.1 mitochondrial chaperone BCS1-like [Hibiscus syriacus]